MVTERPITADAAQWMDFLHGRGPPDNRAFSVRSVYQEPWIQTLLPPAEG